MVRLRRLSARPRAQPATSRLSPEVRRMATLPQWWPRANKSAARPRTPRLPAALRGADAVDGRCGRRGDDHRLLRVQLFGKNNYADALEQSVTAHTHGAHLVTRWRAFMAATRIIHAAGAFLTVNFL